MQPNFARHCFFVLFWLCMVFSVGFVASTTLTTAVVTAIMHVAPNILQWFCIRVPQHPVCMYRDVSRAYITICIVMGISICQHFPCTAVSHMHVSYHACTTASHAYIQRVHSVKKKVITNKRKLRHINK